jgi:hypothetical protein
MLILYLREHTQLAGRNNIVICMGQYLDSELRCEILYKIKSMLILYFGEHNSVGR